MADNSNIELPTTVARRNSETKESNLTSPSGSSVPISPAGIAANVPHQSPTRNKTVSFSENSPSSAAGSHPEFSRSTPRRFSGGRGDQTIPQQQQQRPFSYSHSKQQQQQYQSRSSPRSTTAAHSSPQQGFTSSVVNRGASTGTKSDPSISSSPSTPGQSGPPSRGRKQYPINQKRDFSSKVNVVKPNDVYISSKVNFTTAVEKCKKILDAGECHEIFVHGLDETIPRAISVALELKKFYQGRVDFTSNTGTVVLVDDLVPADDTVSPTLDKRITSTIELRVFISATSATVKES